MVSHSMCPDNARTAAEAHERNRKETIRYEARTKHQQTQRTSQHVTAVGAMTGANAAI